MVIIIGVGVNFDNSMGIPSFSNTPWSQINFASWNNISGIWN